MSKFKVGIISEDTVITTDNVLDIGEITAISAVKRLIAHTGTQFLDIYKGLIRDVFKDHTTDVTYSDGYDIVQDILLFLCENIGRTLGDIIRIDRFGKPVCIWTACFRMIYSNLTNKLNYQSFITELDNTDKTMYKTIEECTDTDYSVVDRIIEEMHLTPVLEETLNCYLAGYHFTDMLKELNVVKSTLTFRRRRLQKLYTDAVASIN